MSSQVEHAVTWHLERGSLWATFTCSAPEGSGCRMWCDSGCDEHCTSPEEHPKVDQGKCLMVDWMGVMGEDVEMYDGGPGAPHDGPVVFEWDGDSYLWRYAADPEESQ